MNVKLKLYLFETKQFKTQKRNEITKLKIEKFMTVKL